MAKRRKRKKNLSHSLKFEVYGILLIVFSFISLAGKDSVPGIGTVGRGLSYMSLLLAGHLYFIVPIIGIYIGLFVMIKRKFPTGWSYKKTGIVLFVLACAIHLHVDLFESRYPYGGQTTIEIWTQPFTLLSDKMSGSITENAYLDSLGGGFIGALSYGLLYVLFDNLGAQLIKWTLIAIALICITGWSYSDMLRKGRASLQLVGKQLKLRLGEAHAAYKSRKSESVPSEVEKHIDVEEDLDEENWTETSKPASTSKRKLFFSLFQSSDKNQHPDGNEKGELVSEEGEEPVSAAPETSTDAPEETVYQAESGYEPLFRDFQEQLHTGAAQPDEDPSRLQPDAGQSIAKGTEEGAQAQSNEGIRTADEGEIPPSSPVLHTEVQSHEPEGEGEERTVSAPPAPPPKPYRLPAFELLSKPDEAALAGSRLDYRANARKLEATLESFGVRARVLEVVRGPSVTRYEIQPDIGVKVSRIVSLTDDIALALAAKDIRMEAPIPGKSAIGIEVPNSEVSVVTMREVMETQSFQKSDAKLSITLGRDISGQPIVANLAKMPHLLVAGATGSGKSVCINGIITSILYKAKPDEVKFLMIDPKMVELNVYNGIPHLLAPVVTDPRRASLALKKVVKEMEQRYELFSKSGTRNIEGYNQYLAQSEQGGDPLPLIVVIVDELADLMMVAANDVEDAICRLAQMARAAGIHLIIATQRPSVDVITGVIKANIPSRIAFGVSSQVDSRTILDMVGAEKLLGRGDMLFMPVGSSKPTRVQGAFLSDQEVEKVVTFVRDQQDAQYQEDMVPQVDDMQDAQPEFEDELFDQAVQIVLEAKQASVSLLQRRMRVGYTRAARLIDSMEAKSIVGPYEGSKPREVLISLEQYQQISS
ncbi:DNA translocase FtsK [Marinicrinis sediminis]|uniref:DNA translocase FtsK n=1 Tax=Marinicrinis sediminis TaxID=1652465 RepID=A0ABW5R5Q1_9BACL